MLSRAKGQFSSRESFRSGEPKRSGAPVCRACSHREPRRFKLISSLHSDTIKTFRSRPQSHKAASLTARGRARNSYPVKSERRPAADLSYGYRTPLASANYKYTPLLSTHVDYHTIAASAADNQSQLSIAYALHLRYKHDVDLI